MAPVTPCQCPRPQWWAQSGPQPPQCPLWRMSGCSEHPPRWVSVDCEWVAQVTTIDQHLRLGIWDKYWHVMCNVWCVMCVFVLRTLTATQGPTAGARAQSQYTRDWTGAARASQWYLIKFFILTHRSCEKLDEKFTLQSPNLVLSVIKVRVAMPLLYFGFNLFNIMRHLQLCV